MVERETNFGNVLPLHLCDLVAFIGGFALLTRNRTLAIITYFWGLAGTLQGIITPAIDIGWPHPAFITFFVHHFTVIAVALYLPIVMNWRPQGSFWNAPMIAFMWLNFYVVVAITTNWLVGTNFGFLASKPANPSILDHLGPHPFYIFWLELIALAAFLLLAVPLQRRALDRHRD